jgi:hypothetical protein
MICEDSAVYVEPHQPEAVAKQLCLIAQDHALKDRLVKAGIERLSHLPTQEERFALVMKELLGHSRDLDSAKTIAA